MTDDIVTRLREHREDELMLGNDWLVDVLGGAADEIERLRNELTQANNQIKLLIAIKTAGKQEESNG